MHRSSIPKNWDGTDSATALGKEIDWVVGVFRITRRQIGKTGHFRYKQKSEKRQRENEDIWVVDMNKIIPCSLRQGSL